eukprot:TRINITY_DN476_c0_g1_i1.p1 TRINITY_DN476_c0_g1~~TRINITY_DN476_c0_g1_i1.p1  ORF type:complete len:970 (-),score=243.89 TRINITY_DN476_c0_g1_i1:22-2802(-)
MYNKLKDKTTEFVHNHDLKADLKAHLPFHHSGPAEDKGGAYHNPPEHPSTQKTGPKNEPPRTEGGDKDKDDKKEEHKEKKDDGSVATKTEEKKVKDDGNKVKETKTEKKSKDGSVTKKTEEKKVKDDGDKVKEIKKEEKSKDGSVLKKSEGKEKKEHADGAKTKKEEKKEAVEHAKEDGTVKGETHKEATTEHKKKDGSLIKQKEKTHTEHKDKDGSVAVGKIKKKEATEHKHKDGDHVKEVKEKTEHKKKGSLIKEETVKEKTKHVDDSKKKEHKHKDEGIKAEKAEHHEVSLSPATLDAMSKEENEKGFIEIFASPLSDDKKGHVDTSVKRADSADEMVRAVPPSLAPHLSHHGDTDSPCLLHLPSIRVTDAVIESRDFEEKEVRPRPLSVREHITKVEKTEERTPDLDANRNPRQLKETKLSHLEDNKDLAVNEKHRTLQTIGTPEITLHQGQDLPYKPRTIDEKEIEEPHEKHRTLQTIGTPEITLHQGQDLPYKPRADSQYDLKTLNKSDGAVIEKNKADSKNIHEENAKSEKRKALASSDDKHRTLQTIGTPEITLHQGQDLPYKPRAVDTDESPAAHSSKLSVATDANEKHRTLQTIGTPEITLRQGQDLPYKPRANDDVVLVQDSEKMETKKPKEEKVVMKKTKVSKKEKANKLKPVAEPAAISRHVLPTERHSVTMDKVIKESVKEVELHKVQPIVHREREQREIRHVVQPIAKHEVMDTEIVRKEKEFDLGTRSETSTMEVSRNIGHSPRIESSREYTGKETKHQELPTQVEEHVFRKIEEHVHPVVYKETLKPMVTEETHHVYETVKERPIETWTYRQGEVSAESSADQSRDLASAEQSFFDEYKNRGMMTGSDISKKSHYGVVDAKRCDACEHDLNQICTRGFQRLSRPYIATLLRRWHDDRYTRGTFNPVLSY